MQSCSCGHSIVVTRDRTLLKTTSHCLQLYSVAWCFTPYYLPSQCHSTWRKTLFCKYSKFPPSTWLRAANQQSTWCQTQCFKWSREALVIIMRDLNENFMTPHRGNRDAYILRQQSIWVNNSSTWFSRSGCLRENRTLKNWTYIGIEKVSAPLRCNSQWCLKKWSCCHEQT